MCIMYVCCTRLCTCSWPGHRSYSSINIGEGCRRKAGRRLISVIRNGRRKIIMTTTTSRYNIIQRRIILYIIIVIIIFVIFKMEISRIATPETYRESQRVKCNIPLLFRHSSRTLSKLESIASRPIGRYGNRSRSRTVSIENQSQSPADDREPWLTLICISIVYHNTYIILKGYNFDFLFTTRIVNNMRPWILNNGDKKIILQSYISSLFYSVLVVVVDRSSGRR